MSETKPDEKYKEILAKHNVVGSKQFSRLNDIIARCRCDAIVRTRDGVHELLATYEALKHAADLLEQEFMDEL